MKIKKVAQTPGVLATVSTSKINSDKDTYSCNYLNDNAVVVSPTEPSDGKVWLQKGKNLINFQSLKVSSGDGAYGVYGINMLNLKPLTSYTISFTKSRIDGSTISNSALYPWYKIYFYKNGTLLSTESCASSNVINGFASGSKNLSKQFVTPTECNRVKIYFDNNNGDANLNTLVSNIQLEQGEVATPYEPYITKKIHTKTDNGYEEFYSEENREVYSTSEQRIGTWLGKPLYRKAGTYATLISKGTLTVLTSVGSNVIDRVVKFNAMCRVASTYYNKNQDTSVFVSTGNFCITPTQDIGEVDYVIEYTKTTD